MKNLVFILLLVISPLSYSQTKVSGDSLPSIKKESMQLDEIKFGATSAKGLNEKLDNYLDLDAPIINENKFLYKKSSLYDPIKEDGSEIKPFDLRLPPLNIYQGPPLESNTFSRNPYINDYRFSSFKPLSEGLWLSSSSIQETYPILGAVRNVDMNINYQPSDWLVLSGGAFVSKYNLGGSVIGDRGKNMDPKFIFGSYNDAGVKGNIKFILHDRIRLNGFGQYSAYGKENGVPSMGMMYPQSYYGGSLEIKITEKFGVESGVVRELNPFNGKWENRPYFTPVFYK